MVIIFFILAFMSNTWTSDAHEHALEIVLAPSTAAASTPSTVLASSSNYGSIQVAPDLLKAPAGSLAEKSKDPSEYTPKRHPVLSKSDLAKQYVKCSTICCFFCKGWFRTGSFLASVASTAVAGVAYGIDDPYYKDKLGLALVLLTFSASALRKFEEYAGEEMQIDEDQFGMFTSETNEKKG